MSIPAAKLTVIPCTRDLMLAYVVIFLENPTVEIAIVPGTRNGTLNPAAMFSRCRSTDKLSKDVILTTKKGLKKICSGGQCLEARKADCHDVLEICKAKEISILLYVKKYILKGCYM